MPAVLVSFLQGCVYVCLLQLQGDAEISTTPSTDRGVTFDGIWKESEQTRTRRRVFHRAAAARVPT